MNSQIKIDSEMKYLDYGRINFSRCAFYIYDLTSLNVEEHGAKALSYVNAIVKMSGWCNTIVWMHYLDSGIAYSVLGGLFRIPELQKVGWARMAIDCLPEI